MPTVQPLRYAHSDGHTDVCFDDSGKHMLTCGTDGDVRVWAGIEDDDAISHRVGDRVYGIVYKSGRFFTSSDTNSVQAHTFPDGAPDGILTRFTAPVNHMVVNQSGKTMVACSSDFTIKAVEVDSCSHKTMQGHEAPVLSVALDPKEEFVASSSCDGTVRIWQHNDHSQVTSMNILPKTNDVSLSKTMCRLCWDLKGENLFVPVEKEIHIYVRSSWKKAGTFQAEDIAGVLSVLALSPDGKTLAAASSEGNILVMDVKTRKCVDRYRHPKKFSVTSLAWNPKKATELAFCDKEGQLGLLEDIKLSLDAQQSIPVQETRAKETLGIFDDDDDDDMLIQATNDEGKVGMELGADNSDDDDQMPVIKPLGDIDDDTMSKKSDLDDGASVMSDAPLELPPAPVAVEGYKPTPLQNPFQPGSTPVHLSSRFMVWNSIGIIKQYNTDEENSIDIEFHNTSIHHAMHITNTSHYTLADMSSEAVVLAAESDDGNPSKLTCMHFGSWDSCKEWTTTMPDGEEIMAVTLGEDWVAVATDKRNVRLFSLGGVQREMLSIPGPVVCMTGHTNQLMAVYHRGMGIPGDQCLGVTLMYVEGKQRTVLGGQPLPLSPKTALAWTGFSAEGTPFYMESSGIVRMFNRKFGPSWMQVANTKSHAKGKSDHYWIVGVNENPQQLRCIPCKGSRYPPVLPRPAVSILPFQVQLCEMNTEKSQYEETLWKTRLFGQHFDHWMSQGFEFEPSRKAESLKPAQEALMKLFALSARSDREFRALEVCEMMPEQHTLQLAIKYASRIKHMHLAERISELAQQKEEEAEQEEDEEDVPEARNGHLGARPKEGGHLVQDEEVMDEGDEEINMDGEEEEEEEDRPSGPMLNLKSKSEKPTRPTFISSARSSNPFKMSQGSQKTAPSGSAKGTQVFDSMNRKKTEKSKVADPVIIGKPGKILVKPKKSTQGNLFATKVKTDTAKSDPTNETPAPQQSTPSAFDLWLEENRVDLEEEHPDLAEADLVQTAAERFREIPREEKQVWITKAKQLKSENSENVQNAENTNTEVPPENKKRKREETDSKETKDIANKKKKDNFLDSKKKPLSQNTNSKLAGFAFQKE
ncbi:WD repeat and HMG-box DNA-binding protein 1-like isoform X2 [Mizuhopecten yessoensis]|uniref:WD repeat and HMG-box DNA-binding protein 1 n=1 Tax=Mizuhopecten yessoensis TaxID=6573 RepID=A0A210QW28_MIZYE|nr:WD repeat and HMG-box DNA-binding protein 1-like isoform X2 [Mizuhopecten yessoensis]OWF52969.1 WD repeat and HMG-box DNA-binding protein 1 [Mizuhopecten yessoensis]